MGWAIQRVILPRSHVTHSRSLWNAMRATNNRLWDDINPTHRRTGRDRSQRADGRRMSDGGGRMIRNQLPATANARTTDVRVMARRDWEICAARVPRDLKDRIPTPRKPRPTSRMPNIVISLWAERPATHMFFGSVGIRASQTTAKALSTAQTKDNARRIRPCLWYLPMESLTALFVPLGKPPWGAWSSSGMSSAQVAASSALTQSRNLAVGDGVSAMPLTLGRLGACRRRRRGTPRLFLVRHSPSRLSMRPTRPWSQPEKGLPVTEDRVPPSGACVSADVPDCLPWPSDCESQGPKMIILAEASR